MVNNHQRVKHPARPDITAGLAAAVRPPDQHATLMQRLQVVLGHRRTIHLLIHGGHYRYG